MSVTKLHMAFTLITIVTIFQHNLEAARPRYLSKEKRVCPDSPQKPTSFNRVCRRSEDCTFGHLCCRAGGQKRCFEGVSEKLTPSLRRSKPTDEVPVSSHYACPEKLPVSYFQEPCRTDDDCSFGNLCCGEKGEKQCVVPASINKILKENRGGQDRLVCPPSMQSSFFDEECVTKRDCNFGYLCCPYDKNKMCAEGIPRSLAKSELELWRQPVCPKAKKKDNIFAKPCQTKKDCHFGYICCQVGGERFCAEGLDEDSQEKKGQPDTPKKGKSRKTS